MSSSRSVVSGITSSVKPVKISDQQRRQPDNKRYAYVGAVIDTGRTARDVKPVEKPLRFGEEFKRISSKDLHALLQDNPDQGESIFQFDESARDKSNPSSPRELCSLGLPSTNNVATIQKTSNDEGLYPPFLLLDLRSTAAHAGAHISKARAYPALDIRRDKMTIEIVRFKQNEMKPIIVYSDIEKEAVEIGTLLVQKHFPNISILSTSFTKYATRFPEDIVGDIPMVGPTKPQRKRGPSNVYVAKRIYGTPASALRATGEMSSNGSTATSIGPSSSPWKPV